MDTAAAPSTPSSVRTGRMPPGPRGRIQQTVRYMRDPWTRTVALLEQYGDTIHFPSFNSDLVLTRDPEVTRALYTLEHTQFTVFGADLAKPLVGGGSLLLQSGEAHRRERKLLTPPFHGARMKAYGALMLELARAETDRWPVGATFDAHASLQKVSMRVILRAVFGLSDPRDTASLEGVLAGYMTALPAPLIFFPVLQRRFFGLGPFDRFLALRERVDAQLFAQIAARRKQPPGDDILSLMLEARYDDGSAMSDAHVRDELLTLLLAGHETTALSLAWLCDFLARDSALVARLRDELATLGPDPEPEALARLPLLEACCHETLRVRPVVNETFRLLTAPVDAGPWHFPAGTLAAASVVGTHFNPKIYPDPQRFRPERFLERKYSPFEFFAFGGGIRRCIGAAMALYEMKMVIATIVQRCELAPGAPTQPRAAFRGLTMGPVGGMPLKLTARRAS